MPLTTQLAPRVREEEDLLELPEQEPVTATARDKRKRTRKKASQPRRANRWAHNGAQVGGDGGRGGTDNPVAVPSVVPDGVPSVVALPVQARDTCDDVMLISDSVDSSRRVEIPTQFRWRSRLPVLGRVPSRVPVPGDGNCMLHSWIVTSCRPTCVDDLRTRICETMHAAARGDAWRQDELYELQSPEDLEREASEWGRLIRMAEPGQSSPPYLRAVHARALAISTDTIVIWIPEHNKLRHGGWTQTVPDLVTVFMPDPRSEYVGVQDRVSTRRGNHNTWYRRYSGNRFKWDDFHVLWQSMSVEDRKSSCILVFDGVQLHYSGTRLQ